MVENNTGSYGFGGFHDNEKELERLKHQARVAIGTERKLLIQLGLKPGMKALDLACGPGVISVEMAAIVGESGSITGGEISDDLIMTAKAVAESEGVKNVQFMKENVYELSFPDNSFDFIYTRLLFQHLENPMLGLKNMLRVLKPGGIACVVDVDDDLFMMYPEPETLKFFMDRASKGQKEKGGDRYIGRKLPFMFEKTGFSDVKAHIESFYARDLGMKTFLDITTGFKLEQVADNEKEAAKKELDLIYAKAHEPNVYASTGVFFVTGSKV